MRHSLQSYFARSVAALIVALSPSLVLSQAKAVNTSTCTSCHANIGEFTRSGQHKSVSCTACHEGLDKHLANATVRPATDMNPAKCGSCHQAQFTSMYKADTDHKVARFEKKLATGPAPNPFFDWALGPHGFTREHNVPRAHSFAALDQFVVDRAFGGRFVPKEGWLYTAIPGGNFKVWDVLQDNYPGDPAQKVFKEGTAAAANAVCWTCKSTDLILEWAYLGDPVPGATWSRTSNVVKLVKEINHAVNCNFCHDPHAAKPRIVRDALIQAVTRSDFPSLYSEDPNRTPVEVKDVGLRGFNRKIGMLPKYDGKLQCGQCHVEYNCNPGIDPKTGQAITMADRRTNVFPFVDVTKIDEFYSSINFKDFRHTTSQALLTKMQHPDTEIYWNSKHDKAGVQCANCHMPKITDAKSGKTYTSHWATSPKNYVKETCLTCHTDKSEKQMKDVMASMQAHYQGKIRAAEGWLQQLFMKFNEANLVGVDDAALSEARKQHSIAHTNWEWWTAANGAAFHNLEQAKTSLAKSISASQAGIKILDDAMKAKRAGAQVAEKK
ncbi:MAG: ammonia-forming cytochrome c nitrite reductase subunit c552 [Burkholderiaceae bacterium]